MDQSIQQILRDHKVKGVFHSHVSMGQTKGKYLFNRQDLEYFWEVYGKAIHENPDTITGIAEKPQHYLPILGDIDIKVRITDDMEINKELHTEKHTKEVIEVYQSVLRKIVDGCTDEQLICVLLEKPLYRVSKNDISYAKHGFHIHFPYCFLNKVEQEVHLIPRVQDMLRDLKTFEDLGFEDSGLMIDKSCCKVPWLMYGSRKESGMDPYKLSKVFNSEGVEVTLEDAFKRYQLFDMREKLIKLKGKVETYLPRILSIIPYGRDVSEVKHGLISPLKEQIQERRKNNKEYKKTTVIQDLAIAKQILPMLSEFRALDRNEWMTIGWILYNIGEGCPDALDLWCEFSSRCEEEYDESVCIYQWERMTRKDLTLGTLRYYASVDSPDRYREFKKEQATKYIHESLNGSHNDIAKVLYAEYGNEFVCASIASKVWFQFVGHRWEEIEDGIFLRKKISGEIVDRYTEIGKEILAQLAACTDKGEEAMYNARLKQVQKMMGNLKAAPYKSNVMKECVMEGSRVSLSNGLSIPIEEMDNNYNVFGWDENIDKLSQEKQTDFMYKGEKECVELTLEDGTTISMTPDHPVLTSVNEWVHAGDLKVGVDRIKTGIKLPEYNPRKEIIECKGWELQVGNYKFSTDTFENYEKTLSFSRILGFLLTDLGSISLNKIDNLYKASVCIDTKLDTTIFLDDLERICDKRPIITESKKSSHCCTIYNISIPSDLTQGIVSLKGIVTGMKVSKEEVLPEFILSENCPISIVREFLAGMFGGDGHAPCLDNSTNLMRSVGFSKIKFIEHKESLYNYMKDLKLLLSRFGINKIINKKDRILSTEVGKKRCVECMIYISMEDLVLFSNKIGYRYCLDNSYKLTCVGSYRQMYEKINEQCCQITEKIYELYEERKNDRECIEDVYNQYCSEHVVLNKDVSYPKYSSVLQQLKKYKEYSSEGKQYKHKFTNKSFPKPMEYMDMLGCGDMFRMDKKTYFIHTEDMNIPVFSHKLVGRREVGVKKVYDISVEKVHSFVANGAVVHNCQEVFYDKRFREKLDTNPALFPFNNGVYDLNNNIFRSGRPEDFISKASPIDYIEFNEDDEHIHDIHDYLEKVFPDKSIRAYFTDIASDIFMGGNHQKHVYFLLGEGDNSKSIIQTLFEKMLGQMAIKFNTTVITGKKVQSGSANPELARAGGGVRLATLEEPNSDEMINIGILKNLSGNDSYYARDLFEKGKGGREINPMFKLFFICNKLPKLKYSDKAVFNRIRVIPFESTFCRPDDPAPNTYEEQLRQKRFPMDKDFTRKIPDMVQAFAWLLLKHRLTLKDRIEPEKVRIATEAYRKENDTYRQFIEECIIEDSSKKLSLVELYSQFKEWFKESFPFHTLPIKNEVEEYFNKVWDEPTTGKKWSGYRIRTLQDDIEDGDAILLDDEDLVCYDNTNLPVM
jgi:P4 family phage/plasmid primase-like protien